MAMTVDQILAGIDTILTKAEPSCVKALVPIMKAKPKPDQVYACLELFHMQSYELVYNAFFIRNKKLVTEYASFEGFKGETSFIPELNEYIQNSIGQVKWTQAEGQDFTNRHEKQFGAWFKKVWTLAGGESAEVPVYFCFEKEYQVQDVKTGKVMQELEAANLLGHQVSQLG